MLRREGVRNGALEIQNADEPVLQEKRNNEFGARFYAALAANVAGIVGDVIDAEDAALAGSSSGQALMKRELHASLDGILVAHGKSTFEELRLFVPEHHAEDMVVDDFLDALGDAAQEFFAVENRGELAAHLVEEQQGLSLFRMRGEKTLRHRIGIAEQSESTELRNVFHDLRRSENIPLLDVTECPRFHNSNSRGGPENRGHPTYGPFFERGTCCSFARREAPPHPAHSARWRPCSHAN